MRFEELVGFSGLYLIFASSKRLLLFNSNVTTFRSRSSNESWLDADRFIDARLYLVLRNIPWKLNGASSSLCKRNLIKYYCSYVDKVSSSKSGPKPRVSSFRSFGTGQFFFLKSKSVTLSKYSFITNELLLCVQIFDYNTNFGRNVISLFFFNIPRHFCFYQSTAFLEPDSALVSLCLIHSVFHSIQIFLEHSAEELVSSFPKSSVVQVVPQQVLVELVFYTRFVSRLAVL